MDYKKLGFIAGLECHQQLAGKKLFCQCPALVNDDYPVDVHLERKIRAAAGETGNVDQAAAYEMAKDRTFLYEGKSTSSCLVEYDEEPIHPVNPDHLLTALEVSLLLHCRIVDEVHFMRKTIVDGSNTSAFQRGALVAMNGYIETSQGPVGINAVCLEEESAKKLKEQKHVVCYSLDRLGVALIEIATEPDIKSPEHAKEVAEKLGMILRSTGKVRRGIGSIRQDVNVSIKGHPRVELKGFQELRSMPKVIGQEVQRQQKEKKGSSHVRKVNQDGSSTFLRPMPGAARMYPETDVEPITITKAMLTTIMLPELLDEKVLRVEKKWKLSPDLAREVVKRAIDLEQWQYKKVSLPFVLQVLIEYPKEMKKRYGVKKVSDAQVKEVLGYLDKGKIQKGAVLDVLVSVAQGRKVDLSKYAALDTGAVDKVLKDIIKKHKGAPLGALMGIAMKELGGKVEGKQVMALLQKLIKNS